MLSTFQRFGKVIAIRRRRPQETTSSTSHPSSATANLPQNVSSTKSRLSEAGDIVQFVSPIVQAAAGAIPVAGPPLKAAIDGLLYIIQIIDTKNRNKADLDDLASRVRRLLDFLEQEPQPRDDEEVRRRIALTARLEATSRNLMTMQSHRGLTFAYPSVTKDISGCKTDINDFLVEYAMYNQAVIKKQNEQILSQVKLLVSPGGCAILVDAVGHEHKVPLEFCTSFQQLVYMLRVLLEPERSGASVQRRYINSGDFDFCIDDGKRVTQLSSGSNWPNIEAGTKVVMRVIFEQMTRFSATYTCHLCGATNKLTSFSQAKEWLMDGSVDCYECKGRFQISVQLGRRGQRTIHPGQVSGNDASDDFIDKETRHCIRNFLVTQVRPEEEREFELEFREYLERLEEERELLEELELFYREEERREREYLEEEFRFLLLRRRERRLRLELERHAEMDSKLDAQPLMKPLSPLPDYTNNVDE